MKAVESSPRAVLVFTLAVGKDMEATDAYREEHERAVAALAEAESVASRKATQLNPTEEDETADVLRRRLFDRVDSSAANAVVDAYRGVWDANASALPQAALTVEMKEQFLRGYPLHPETLSVLTEKTASLSTFHRTRGMLRLLARTVHVLWRDRPADAYAIHPHHIDPGFGPIRDEITVRLGQGEYTPALKSDVAAVPGDDPSVAQLLDAKYYPGQLPITSYIARTVFLNTLAYGDAAKGVNPDLLKLSVCSPSVEPSFIEQARVRFVAESLYLDDRPGAPMRLMVEPNLEQVIRKQMVDVDTGDERSDLQERIRALFGGPGQSFQMVPFPAGYYQVPDEVGDGRPLLVVLHYEAVTISSEPKGLPPEVDEICKYKGTDQKLRDLRNNLVFVVADERLRENMKQKVRRRLALHELRKPERIRQLAEYQQRKVHEQYEKLSLEIAETILHCYRHLFYPSHISMPGTSEPIAHSAIEVHNASDSPGNGQVHVARILRDQKKLLGEGDQPDAPSYVRDQTPLKTKGEITTAVLRNEFRKAPKLSILLVDSPLITCIREGINSDVFIYREGDQVWGKGDPAPSIKVSENAFVHTMADAQKKKLWPRSEPLSVSFSASPKQIEPGKKADLKVTVTGGVGPYTYACSEPALCMANTSQTALQTTVSPETSATYQIDVTDSRGQKKTATVDVLVAEAGKPPKPPKPPEPPKPPQPPKLPTDLNAEGPLAQALTELWEKARKAKVVAISRLIVKFYEAPATWKVHQAVAMLKGAEVTCRFEAEMQAEGIQALRVEYEGGCQGPRHPLIPGTTKSVLRRSKVLRRRTR